MALSPDGKTLVTESSNHTARVWDLSVADPAASVKALHGHDDFIASLTLNGDGRMLVTGSKEMARLWDLSAADPAASARVLRGHNGIILNMVVRPNKTTLVTVSNDGTARVWDLRVEALQKLATLVAGRDLSDEEREQYRLPASKDSSYGEFGTVELLAWECPQFPRPTDAACHERQATECELIGNAFGAVFHLERLLTFRPDDVEVLKRLAMAREELRSAASKAENSFQIPGAPPIDIPEPRPNGVK